MEFLQEKEVFKEFIYRINTLGSLRSSGSWFRAGPRPRQWASPDSSQLQGLTCARERVGPCAQDPPSGPLGPGVCVREACGRSGGNPGEWSCELHSVLGLDTCPGCFLMCGQAERTDVRGCGAGSTPVCHHEIESCLFHRIAACLEIHGDAPRARSLWKWQRWHFPVRTPLQHSGSASLCPRFMVGGVTCWGL